MYQVLRLHTPCLDLTYLFINLFSKARNSTTPYFICLVHSPETRSLNFDDISLVSYSHAFKIISQSILLASWQTNSSEQHFSQQSSLFNYVSFNKEKITLHAPSLFLPWSRGCPINQYRVYELTTTNERDNKLIDIYIQELLTKQIFETRQSIAHWLIHQQGSLPIPFLEVNHLLLAFVKRNNQGRPTYMTSKFDSSRHLNETRTPGFK